MTRATLFAGLAALAASFFTVAVAQEAPAAAAEPPPIVYPVIDENARIPFSTNRVNGFQVGEDDSLIIRVGANRWYRAELWPGCDFDLPFEHAIAIASRPDDTIDRFSVAIVNGRRCPFQTFDRIEDPGPVEEAWRAARDAARASAEQPPQT